MGTGAIAGEAPYPDVEAALADGKTQEEIDSYKASPGPRRVAPQLTMTAAMKREMDLVMKRWNKQDDEIDSWESSLKSRAAACKKEGLVQLAAFDSQQGVTIVEDDVTTPAASSGDTNRTLPDHVRRACITTEGGGGGVGRVPIEALEVRALASEAELQLLLAWLYQDETDERNSPNCWFSRASASLVHAFDEGRLFGTFLRAGESRVREKRAGTAAGRGGGGGREAEVEDGCGDEDSTKLTAGVTCSSAVMLPGGGKAEKENLREKESKRDCAKDGDNMRDIVKDGDKAVSECGLNGDKNGHADIIGDSDGEICGGGATPPRIGGEPRGDTPQQEKDDGDGVTQSGGKKKIKDADTSPCTSTKLTSSSAVGTRMPPRQIASCPIAFCATKHVEVVGANSGTKHELIDATGVRRNCRGVGLGRYTAEYFVERARAAGREGYEVEAHPGANGFWRKLGFRPDTTSKQQQRESQSQSIYCVATNKTCQKMTVVFTTNDYIRNYL